MRTFMAFLFALVFFSPKANAGAIHLADDIASIPPYISNIEPCARWKTVDGEGYYRVIYVDFYHGNSLLYIQWVKETISSSDYNREVIKTLSIDEFNGDDHIEFMFKKPHCFPTKDGARFHIMASSGHDEKMHSFQLRVFSEPGKYSIHHAVSAPKRRTKP